MAETEEKAEQEKKKKEKVFYNNNGVVVTNTRVIVDRDTYVLAHLTYCKARSSSESVMDTTRSSRRKAVRMLGFILILATFLYFYQSGLPFYGILASLFLYMLMAMVLQFLRDRTYEYKIYKVIFGSLTGEHEAICSRDKKFVDQVVRAVNDAIIWRG